MASNGSGGELPRHLKTAVMVLITCLWGASVAAQLFSSAYDPPTGLNEVFTAVVMYLFARQGAPGGAPPAKKENDDE